jgi:Domain of unknown function (DUF4440)
MRMHLLIVFVLLGVNLGSSTNDDQAKVASLDTDYQAAVKRNDAATIDRILAEDFVLVTGSGKTYTKADLLAEARDGQIVYERQQELAQTVRMGGTRRWLPRNCGRKVPIAESRLTEGFGSATSTSPHQQGGGMYLANHRCP